MEWCKAFIGDNFDQDIASQNGKKQTHSMALLLTQPQLGMPQKDQEETKIPRLKKSEMKKEIPYELEIARYTGPKKQDPPKGSMDVKVLSLLTLVRMAIAVNRARETDFCFLKCTK